MADEARGYWDMQPEERAMLASTRPAGPRGGNWDLKGNVTIDDGPYGPGPREAWALGPSGPVRFDTTTGFEAQADTPPGQLTAEEVAEFRALRAEKKRRDAEAAA